ncbi:hypothetical protein NST45_02890 [Paenibacillus sp. FSL R7-0163]|uniref:hypothetical protein n=1 Tax=Paenibacillus sp. FSL R7-0163 TaxID=2954530 RepID=UPI0030DBCA5A
MKLILVHISPIIKYPPALSVLKTLNDLGIDLTLCTTDIDSATASVCENRGIKVINFESNYEKPISPLLKLIRLLVLRNQLWKEIDNIYDSDTMIWVFSDLALKHLGSKLLEKKFILHMFELSEKTIFYRKIPFISLNTKMYAKKAVNVIQAEYNRAHISKTWWDLERLPYVLPNKPYIDFEIDRYSSVSDKEASIVINHLKGKKIILYQGILSPERPLVEMINAVNDLGDEYAFVIISSGKNIYENISSNYYFLPFIAPPYHLEVTSNAYIGVLSYVPSNNEYSKLNSLYCAPNKIYEYSMFGVPMIGNDIPGLSHVLETNGCGVCFEKFEVLDIKKAIKEVENNYESLAQKAKEFYGKTDIELKIKEIMDSANS